MIGWLRTRRKARALRSFESLETRTALDADGLLPGISGHFSLSFAPDGTAIDGHSSSLFAKLQPLAADRAWQDTILRAFQVWSSQTNADVGLVDDHGQAFGTPGPRWQDSRFGDVRIGAAPLSPDVLAISIPASAPVAGSWNGDVIINSDAAFASLDDLFAVMVHEAGHVFGLDHSEDPLSPMHTHGITPNTVPTDTDVQRLQDQFGERAVDVNELDHANDTEKFATRLQPVPLPGFDNGAAPAIAFGDIHDLQDVDLFRVETTSHYDGPMTVRLRTRGLSSLTADVQVADEDGNVVAQMQTSGAVGREDLVLTWNADRNVDQYLVRVMSRDATSSSIGSYALVATLDQLLQVDQPTIEQMTGPRYRFVTPQRMRSFFESGEDPLRWADDHADDVVANALPLKTAAGFVEDTRYEAWGTITDSTDRDFLQFKAPNGSPQTLTVTVHSWDAEGLIPQIEILDRNREPVAHTVLINGSGELTVQVNGAEPGANYFVAVFANHPVGDFATGNYRAMIRFGGSPLALRTLGQGVVTAETPRVGHQLLVAQTQLFHFLLDAEGSSSADQIAIHLSLGGTPLTILAAPGDHRSAGGVLLPPGTYTLDVQLAAAPGADLTDEEWAYTIRGEIVSTPFGVIPLNPLDQPIFQCENIPDKFCFPGGVVIEDPFYLYYLGMLFPNGTRPNNPGEIDLNWWRQQVASGENHAPVAVPDEFETPIDQPLEVTLEKSILRNDIDLESDLVTAELIVDPEFGTLDMTPNGTFVYVPNPGFQGVDQFQYVAHDALFTSRIATVTIRVVGPSAQPGDANRDGVFDSSDLVAVFQAGQYEDGVPGNSTWETGDWTGDGEFDSADLILAFAEGHYTGP